MNRCTVLTLALLFAISGNQTLFANDPISVTWKDLLPDKAFEDPYEKLSDEQLQDLGYAARVRVLIAQDKLSADGADAKAATEIETRLNSASFDVPYLISLRNQVRRMRVMQAKTVQPKFVEKNVILSAYVIPLRSNGDLVIECFLVGTFDACSHSAPPPPNQAIHLKLARGFSLPHATTPVRVSGRLRAKQTTRIRPRSANRTEMTSAYAILDPTIEPLKEKALSGPTALARPAASAAPLTSTSFPQP